MGKYIINGNNKLFGEIEIQGSKNSALAILFATLITSGETVLSGIPDISDVKVCTKILRYFGAQVIYLDRTTIKIITTDLEYRPAPDELTSKLRASTYLLGALTARFGKCRFEQSGGCDFGGRPLNLHYQALCTLGATVENGNIEVKRRLVGAEIIFRTKSVGATINSILAASKANGATVIKNASCEPHVKDLCSFLNKCGVRILGAGTDTLTIFGSDRICGCNYKIDTDMIETGTYLIASVITGGKIVCKNAPIDEMDSLCRVLINCGADVKIADSQIFATAKKITSTNVITAPYPDFPTDLQPQICTMLGLAKGQSCVTESVFTNRFCYAQELIKAGFIGKVQNNTLHISGIKKYSPANMRATDLRGGAAVVLAALSADGQSVIENSELIERGYSDFVTKLSSLGADIKRG